MLIQELDISGFLGRPEPLKLNFNPDLNIITGFNGAGKTNLLKSIWYIVSGNTHALLNEVDFNNIRLKTDLYELQIFKVNHNTLKATFKTGEASYEFEDEGEPFDEDSFSDARDRLNERVTPLGTSIFFPTFRRIEGGFTIPGVQHRSNLLFNAARPKGELADAIAAISRKLSNGQHTFVTSIATFDIAELLLRHFNEMSSEANDLQETMSQSVINSIRVFRQDTEFDNEARTGQEAVETIANIQRLIEEADLSRERIMAPMRAVQQVVSKIFRHKGIQINRRVSFGDAVNAISSDVLSAGEKQMLSFICYNAFTENSPIFIDEPELSLHVDWQRILFPTLESQQKNNQFIIATHSPFIYNKYPEKEIALISNRGDEGGN